MRWGGRPDINALAVGDEVCVPINCIPSIPRQLATVIYIHPKKRFFTVEFNDTKIHESYCAYGSFD